MADNPISTNRISRGGQRSLIVFVHGVLGSQATWRNSAGVSWPELVESDVDLLDVATWVVNYDSTFISRVSTIEEIATRVLRQLEDAGVFTAFQQIHFIAHSMGGLIAKRMLVQLNRPGQVAKLRRVGAVIFLSTPSQGATLANVIALLSFNPQYKDMAPAEANSFIQAIDNDWQTLLRDRDSEDAVFPRSFCAYETKSTHGFKVVSRISAETRTDQNPYPVDRDHLTISKPDNHKDDVYCWAKARIREAIVLTKIAISRKAEPEITGSGLFLTRIIGQPVRERGGVSAVYLSAAGRATYFVDSVRIVHTPGLLMSIGSGPVLPEAEYQFKFRYDSDETYLLNPALRMSPDDRREIWFTLALAPERTFPSTGGYLRVWLNYHSAEGAQGSLFLSDIAPWCVMLATLVGADVKVIAERDGSSPKQSMSLIVTPFGIQRGDEGHGTPFVYVPLSVARLDLRGLLEMPRAAMTVAGLEECEPLYRAIENGGGAAAVVEWAATGDWFALSVCAGIADERCETALVAAARHPETAADALHWLSVRHLVRPSEALGGAVLDALADNARAVQREENIIVTALVTQPVGKWAEVLFGIANRSSTDALFLRRHSLTSSQHQNLLAQGQFLTDKQRNLLTQML